MRPYKPRKRSLVTKGVAFLDPQLVGRLLEGGDEVRSAEKRSTGLQLAVEAYLGRRTTQIGLHVGTCETITGFGTLLSAGV
jgi:hypothetical protein